MDGVVESDTAALLPRRRCVPQGVLVALACAVCVVVGFVAGLAIGARGHAHGHNNKHGHGLWRVHEQILAKAKFVDLTHSLSPSSPVWSGFGPMSVQPAVAGGTFEGFIEEGEEWSYANQGFIATSYLLTTDQFGTQLDPPAHWNELGATISDIPPTVAVHPLVVIDVHDKVVSDPAYSASADDVLAWEDKHGRVPPNSVVLFRTDWGLRWDEFAASGTTPEQFPGVELAALKLLHNERGILVHGHEPLDTDSTASLEGEAWLLHNDFMQLEGVANLHLVPEAGALVVVGFSKFEGGTGGYARLVAICPEDWPHGETLSSAPAAPLPKQRWPLRRGQDGVLRPTEGADPTVYCAEQSAALGCPLPQ